MSFPKQGITPFCWVSHALQFPSHHHHVWKVVKTFLKKISHLQTSCCWWSSCRAFWDTARAAKIMLSSEIIQSLYRKPCDSGVTRAMVSGRTGKDWLKIKRMISKLSELSSQSRYRLHLNNHLADAMLRPVWEEALKWRARKRCLKAPCAAITFICKFWLAPMGCIACLSF